MVINFDFIDMLLMSCFLPFVNVPCNPALVCGLICELQLSSGWEFKQEFMGVFSGNYLP